MAEESTTPDLEDAVRRAVEAFDRGDWDAAPALYTPDAVWDNSPIGGEVFEGREAIRGFFEDWRGSYEDYEQVIEEIRDLGNGVTFAVIFHRARPRDSGGVVTFRYGAVGIWRDGLGERFTIYTDIDTGRAAAERLVEEPE